MILQSTWAYIFILLTFINVSFALDYQHAEETFLDLFTQSESDGDCNVERLVINNSTFYVPTDPKNAKAKFNILGWGNGSGMKTSTYNNILHSIATHCVLVAAANTSGAGSGKQIQSAVEFARRRFADKVFSQPKVCTSGHSQGGGGAFNAATFLNANCIISVQADVTFTSKIKKPVSKKTEVIALWGDADTIAPAAPTNLKTIIKNSSLITSVETVSENHFALMSNRGGTIGTLFRMAVRSQLSNNLTEEQKFRSVFWGPENPASVEEDSELINMVWRSSNTR